MRKDITPVPTEDDFSSSMRRMMQRMWNFDHPFFDAPSNWAIDSVQTPLTDLYETDNAYIAQLDLPGVEKKDIDITVQQNGLMVQVEKNEQIQQSDKKSGFHRIERRHQAYQRFIRLPEDADLAHVNAEYKNGVLALHIDKKEGRLKLKKIDVK